MAFFTVLVVGLIAHARVLLGDFPNHDGLSSMYFDQNMITSARWFLTVACGISSYFTLPWLIGLLSLLFLGIGAAALVEFLEIDDTISVVVISALLVSFPALASTYAYIFTADGYMFALAMVFLAVAFVEKGKYGWIEGAICLAFSMGTYQSYLAFAMILCTYGCVKVMLTDAPVKGKCISMLKYLGMGALGIGLYYAILQILLKAEGKQLDTYQGINGMADGAKPSLLTMLKSIYSDFIAFSGKGNVLFNNWFSLVSVALLVLCGVITGCVWMAQKGCLKKWYTYPILLAIVLFLPIASNMILIISPDVTYHLLMRYQWILYPILLYSFIMRYGSGTECTRPTLARQWICLAAVAVLILNYVVTDNIAYFNLEKKYEKTYAYCLRMVDRMEQTEGYYSGIPVAMVGVQNKENLPTTDITLDVTSNMIGMTGDYLVYTDTNYQSFMQNYLGVTINLVPDEEMERIYYTEEYQALNSFPENGSMKVVDGVLYIKTE